MLAYCHHFHVSVVHPSIVQLYATLLGDFETIPANKIHINIHYITVI